MSKNVIGFVDIHEYVSVNMSMSMSMSVIGIKDVEHVNEIDTDILGNGVSFQKR